MMERTTTRANFETIDRSNLQLDRVIIDSVEFHISLIERKNLSGESYRQIRRAIIDGRLRPGELLPPTRELAHRLSVARSTVTVAYDRLAAKGSSHSGLELGRS